MDMDSDVFVKVPKKVHIKAYDVKVTQYKDGIQVKLYDSVIYADKKEESKENSIQFKNDKIYKGRQSFESSELKQLRPDSLSRTRNKLIDYASENVDKWKSFLTLTFDPKKNDSVSDLNYANKQFNVFVTAMRRYMKKKGSEFFYLGVPEFQQKGAVHYHLLSNLEVGSDALPLQKDKKNMYDVRFWKYGFTSAFNLKLTDDKFNVALYITKYLYKDIDNRLFGRNKILKSNNLDKPNVYKLMSDSVVYQTAMAYIKEKGYQPVGHFEFRNPIGYQMPFVTDEYKCDNDDYEILSDILVNDLEF